MTQALVLALFALASFVLVQGPSASATTGVDDYPYRGAQNTCAAGQSTYNWCAGTRYASPWGFYLRQCTDFVAWRMVNDNKMTTFKNLIAGPNGKTAKLGNAYNWDNAAASAGFRVDHTPARGSVAQWDAGAFGASAYGHVAWVSKVNADGTVNLEEYNFDGTGRYHTRTGVSSSRVSHFIHFKDMSATNNPTGKFDIAISYSGGHVTVRGWAKDADSPSSALKVEARVTSGGTTTYLGSTTANKSRSDVGAHGFDAAFNHPISAAWSKVCVRAVNVGGGTSTTWCKSLALSAKCGRVGTMMRRSDGATWLVRYDCRKHYVAASHRDSVAATGVPTYNASNATLDLFTSGEQATVTAVDEPSKYGPSQYMHYVNSSAGSGGDFWWTQWNNNTNPVNYARWTHSTPSGSVRVRVFVPGDHATADVRYTVHDGTAKECDVEVNQAKRRGWVTLCDVHITSGKTVITLPDNRGAGPKYAYIGWDNTMVVPIR